MEENNDTDLSIGEVKDQYNGRLQDENSKICLPSNKSSNSNDSCSEEIQTHSSGSKYAQHKDLMNCIAFEKSKTIEKDDLWNDVRYSDDFDSLSSDTTSDITDVSPPPPSPPPSSSGCSSILKGQGDGEGKYKSENTCSSIRERKPYKQPSTKSVRNALSTEIVKRDDDDDDDDGDDEHSITFLKDALHNLDCQSSVKSSFSSVRNVFPQPKNLTFSKEQMRNINRENMILLRKIQSSRNRSKLDSYSMNFPRVSSSAINRQRQQRKIEFENSILLQKIQRVKGTTNTMIGFRRF